MSSSVDVIFENIKKMIRERNNLSEEKFTLAFRYIASNAQFICPLQIYPQKFTVSISGQVISFEIFFDALLSVWKATLMDAIGDQILSDITLLAGVNNLNGMHAQYKWMQNGQVVQEDLVLKGLFVTEPSNIRLNHYQEGPERSQWAFAKDSHGNCVCAILMFTNKEIADLYASLINGESGEEFIDLERLDYKAEVK